MKAILLIVICFTAVFTLSCHSTADPDSTANKAFTFTGKIDNPNNITIPDDARMVVAWFVVGGHSGYAYVYGNGTINRSDNTFTVSFDSKPPVHALYDGTEAGIAFVALVNQAFPQNEPMPNGTQPIGFKYYGRMESASITYITDTAKIHFPDSVQKFPNGYTYGKAVFPSTGHDYFIPGDKSTAILRIDTTIKSFTNVNWM